MNSYNGAENKNESHAWIRNLEVKDLENNKYFDPNEEALKNVNFELEDIEVKNF